MSFKKINLPALIAILFISFSCGPQSSNENVDESETSDLPDDVKVEQALYDDILLVHDEIMPKMEDIMRIKGEIIEKSDLLRENNTDAEKLSKMEETLKLLESADEAMMGWMHNFKPQRDNVSHDDVVDYYTKQKSAIDSVKILMEAAIVKGKEVNSN